MKYPAGATLSIPFINTKEDGETERCWARLDFVSDGPVDRRRIKREIRRWVARNLNRHISKYELELMLKRVQDKRKIWR